MRQKSFNDKWLGDPVLQVFADLDNVEFKPMFGCMAVYQIRGDKRIMVACSGGTEKSGNSTHFEWQGLLIPTENAYHEPLIKQFTALRPHAVLRKWLYIHDSNPDFDKVLTGIYKLVREQHEWVGVEQKPRKKKS